MTPEDPISGDPPVIDPGTGNEDALQSGDTTSTDPGSGTGLDLPGA